MSPEGGAQNVARRRDCYVPGRTNQERVRRKKAPRREGRRGASISALGLGAELSALKPINTAAAALFPRCTASAFEGFRPARQRAWSLCRRPKIIEATAARLRAGPRPNKSGRPRKAGRDLLFAVPYFPIIDLALSGVIAVVAR
jgi:hypothetical protein